MPKKKRSALARNLPGSIYRNKKRWWWKVQLPGEPAPAARPLRPLGARFATTDYAVAVEIAKQIWETAIFETTDQPPRRIRTVAGLAKAYLVYARRYYKRPDGEVSSEPLDIQYSIKPLITLFDSVPIEEFGPLKLIAVQNRMIELDLSRRLINQRVGRIKRMFRWGVCRQVVSPVVYQGLAAVEGLKRGRSAARETQKVKPVDEKHIFMVLPHTTPVIAAMIELQLLTGMRPGELVIIRPCDIDRKHDVWHYRPARHKTDYRDIERIISIGPRGQDILTPFLDRPKDCCCFSPAESERMRREKVTQERKTPPAQGNRPGTNIKDEPKKHPGDKYDRDSYRRAVKYAITKTRKIIRDSGGNADKELPYWTPYRLRHTAATKVRQEFGYESAGAALGHTKMSATAIYAERNQGLADQAARKFG